GGPPPPAGRPAPVRAVARRRPGSRRTAGRGVRRTGPGVLGVRCRAGYAPLPVGGRGHRPATRRHPMSMSEPPTPSQAEGERDDDPDTRPSPPHPTPSQAEGEPDDEEGSGGGRAGADRAAGAARARGGRGGGAGGRPALRLPRLGQNLP